MKKSSIHKNFNAGHLCKKGKWLEFSRCCSDKWKDVTCKNCLKHKKINRSKK